MKKILSLKPNASDEDKTIQSLKIPPKTGCKNQNILFSENLSSDLSMHPAGHEGPDSYSKKNDIHKINTALKVLLKKREEDRKEVEEKIIYNIQKLIFPYLDQLKNSSLNESQKELLDVIENNLDEVSTSFSKRLSLKFYNLSKNEIKVANLVKIGKKTPEIAEIMKLSNRTVEGYRQKIRQKLRIQNKQINLRTYLFSI